MQKKAVLAFVQKDYEELELLVPKYRLLEAGYQFVIAGPKAGETYLGKHGYPCKADMPFDEMDEKNFIAVVIPGGFAPDKLRRDLHVLKVVKSFHEKQKLVAYICHAGWVPISAKIVKGVRLTSVSAIKDDLVNAGALWVDEQVVVDRNHITSRGPEDLPYFCKEIIRYLETHNYGELK